MNSGKTFLCHQTDEIRGQQDQCDAWNKEYESLDKASMERPLGPGGKRPNQGP